MANELLQRALEECGARKFRNEAEERRRMADAVARSPRIAALDAQRREDVLNGLRLAIEGKNPEGIVGRTLERNAEIARLLKEGGLPEDYLEPVYQCAACRDSGYTGDVPRTLCGCVRQRYLELLGGGQEQEDGPSFERYDERVYPEKAVDGAGTTQRRLTGLIRRKCEQYADGLPSGTLNLLLHGPSGLGKTYLLKCVARRAQERGIEALSLNANALLNQIRQAYFSREDEVGQPYYDVPLLLIDDLGTEPLWENITLEQLFALLEYRLERRKNTVISTNLTPDNLRERYTKRIYSRLVDERSSLVLRFQGEDVRLIPRG